MIEELTIEKLKGYGFKEDDFEIKKLPFGGYISSYTILFIDEIAFVADPIQKIILSGRDAWREIYFNKGGKVEFPLEDLDLAPEYYEKKLALYLEEQSKIAKSIFNESVNKEKFKKKEITNTEEILKQLEFAQSHIKFIIKSKAAYNHYLIWLKNMQSANSTIIDPFVFINPDVKNLFIEAEKIALGGTGKFSSEIRCAAFCELLYSKKYIVNTKKRRVTINQFSRSRYGIDLKNALETSKNNIRETHKNRTVKGEAPLKACFR